VSATTADQLKAAVNAEIDRYGRDAVALAKHILDNPEPGFREHRTSNTVAQELQRLGIPFQDGIAITGLRATLDGGHPGPTVGVMGELDYLIVLGHPHADPNTSTAHACGHHCQIGALLAVARGLHASGVMKDLSGRVALMAVPAEEYIEIEYRDELRRAGELEFLGGKAEFIRLGALDDVDLAMMTHTDRVPPSGGKIGIGASNNGMLAKRIRFTGRAAHAGGSPHAGINALNAAMIAMSAIHAQRETFKDEDTIRVHPIITQGGVAVSSVPADVRMETFVRGKSIEAFQAAGRKVDRALRAGAMAVGGSVSITTLPGYLPIRNHATLQEIYVRNAAALVGEDAVFQMGHRSGSTDMGDVSQLMPVLHPYVSAATGNAHGADYLVEDYDLGVITAARAMAGTVVDLLADGASAANRVLRGYEPPMAKSEYLTLLRGMHGEETFTE
jgi:amidohydrolase